MPLSCHCKLRGMPLLQHVFKTFRKLCAFFKVIDVGSDGQAMQIKRLTPLRGTHIQMYIMCLNNEKTG